jgi:hypothetical protein
MWKKKIGRQNNMKFLFGNVYVCAGWLFANVYGQSTNIPKLVLTRQVECQIRCMFRALKFHFLL